MTTITSGGIVRDRRVHILNGADWARSAGTDFWIIGGASEETVATGAGLRTLDGGGWTATSIAEYSGSTGDFLSSSDDDPSAFHFNAASDLIQSPAVFGSYAHAYMAQQFLGAIPTELNLEIYARHLDGTNNETASGFGFVEGGGSIITANDALAVIFSDGTNFKLRSGAATSAAGAVDDTAYHLWRIMINASAVSWYNNGTLVNTIALEADEWPVHFGMGVQAAGANFMTMAWAHIWYA
jgi:hypothetical protein